MSPLLSQTVETADGNVSLTPFAVSIRFHGKTGRYGDPFNFVCTAVIVGDEAKLFAAAGKMSAAVFRAVSAALRQIGIVHATFERRNKRRPRARKHVTAH